MINEKGIQRDGWTTLVGGMDSGNEPPMLKENQAAFLGNLTVRGGYALTRPGFRSVLLSYEDSEIEDWINLHAFQGSGIYEPLVGDPYFVSSIGGRIFKTSLSGSVTEITPGLGASVQIAFITPPVGMSQDVTVDSAQHAWINYWAKTNTGKYKITGVAANVVTLLNISDQAGINMPVGSVITFCDPNAYSTPQAWIEQAEDWLFIQDGQSACIIWDGVKAVRSDATANQVPCGTMMKYYDSIGRLAVAVDGSDVALSDIQGGDKDIRYFTEEHEESAGRFRIPRQYGSITSLNMIANLDTTLGTGPLLVGTERRIMALTLTPDRKQWPSLNALQTTAMINYGPTSQWSTVNVNGDMFYRATDGIRSFIMARRDFGTWGNTPISSEMGRIVDKDDPNLLKYSSGVLFSNRLLMTASPRPIAGQGWYHQGIVVLDFDPVSAMGQKSPPVYDGLWTGIQPVQLLKLTHNRQDRCFAWTWSDNGLGLWEITADEPFDGDGGRPICWVETRGFKGRSEFELKELESLELWWDSVFGTVDVDVKYRPDGYPCWFDWRTKTMCAKSQQCQNDDECVAQTTFEEGYKTRMGMRRPPVSCETADGKPSDRGYHFDIRIEWEGRARLKKGLVKFKTIVEEVNPET